MPSISSLTKTLSVAHPEFSFRPGDRFSWSPTDRTIFYIETSKDSAKGDANANSAALLLHELSHALLDHHTYQRDVELLAMEAAAWEAAKHYTLAHPDLGANIDETVIQDHLDTYRDWLHARSTCPHCTATGYQTGRHTYRCPACAHEWRVNEARLCSLRRYRLA